MGTRRVLRSHRPASVRVLWTLCLLAAALPAFGDGDGLSAIQREIRSFTFKSTEAQSVSLVGDFNGWNERAHRLQKLSDGMWQVDIALRKGKTYEYGFLVDGKLLPDPTNKILTEDGTLSVVRVGEKAEVFTAEPGAKLEAMQLSLNKLVEQISYLSRQVEELNRALRAEHDLVLKKEAAIDLLRTELESARMEKVASARDLVTKEAKLAEITERYNSLRLDHQEKSALLDSHTQRVTTLQKSIDEFQTKYNNALQETRDLREKSQGSIARAATAEQELAQLRSRSAQMERELRERTASLEILTGKRRVGDPSGGTPGGSGIAPDRAGTAPRGLNGQVLAVSEKINLLFISIGEDHGVAEGQEFYAYRGDEFLGRIAVKKAYKDQAEAFALEGTDLKKLRNGDTITDTPRGPIPDAFPEPPQDSGSNPEDKTGVGPGSATPNDPGTGTSGTEPPAGSGSGSGRSGRGR